MFSSLFRLKGSISWWWGFSLLIATPALLLALLGLRAARADRIEQAQQLREQRSQLARLIDASISTSMAEIESELRQVDLDLTNHQLKNSLAEWHLFSFQRDGTIVFYQDRIYFAQEGDHLPLKPIPSEWQPRVSQLIEDAQTAEAQDHIASALSAYRRIAMAEPKLKDWVELSIARLEQKEGISGANARLADPSWSACEGFTPTGLPVAIVASAHAARLPPEERRAFLPLINESLKNLRRGSWWLSYDERRFYDNELRALPDGEASSASARTDERLEKAAAIAHITRESPPSRRDAPTRRLETSDLGSFLILWLPSSRDPNMWLGIAATQSPLTKFLDVTLDGLLSREKFRASIKDTQGVSVWGTPNNDLTVTQTEALRSMAGWEIAFVGTPSSGWLDRRLMFWYGFICLLVVMLAVGIAMTVRVIRREAELARMQNDFVAAVSHDFKGPITGIRLLMERLASGHVQQIQNVREYYAAINAETRKLERHVNRLLGAQQIQEGRKRYRFAQVSLMQIVNAAVDEFQSQTKAKHIRIEVKAEPDIPEARLDQAAITEAIENLIDNAIKYSSANTTISINLGMVRDHFFLEVQDEGIGIDKDDLPHVCDRFYRGRRQTDDIRGTGLGLALVKATAAAHGGSIEVSSEIGKGSRFSLWLPHDNRSENGSANSDS